LTIWTEIVPERSGGEDLRHRVGAVQAASGPFYNDSADGISLLVYL